MKRIADTSGYFSTHENLNKCCMIKATVYSDEKNNRVVIKCYSANNLSRLDAIKNVYISNDEYESLTDKYDAYNVSGTYDLPLLQLCGVQITALYDDEI